MKYIDYIFSKDRPAQLEALFKKLPEWGDVEIVYTFSSTSFEEGYEKLKNDYLNYRWTVQNNLTKQFLETISKYDVVCLLTDDSYFYRTPQKPNLDGVGCFSYRLGYNTIVQDPFKKTYQHKLNAIEEENYIKWNSENYHPLQNYGYFYSMDGCCYHTKDLIKIIDFEFNNPSQLESQLVYKKNPNTWIRSERQSSLVNIPLNNVGGFAEFVDQNLEELNEQFLKDKHIEYIMEPIKGCHQILKWKLI